LKSQHHSPADAAERRAEPVVICYETDKLPAVDLSLYRSARESAELIAEIRVEPRDAACFEVPAGHFFRVVGIEGSQVGDLNLWNLDNLQERFYSGKTRQLHGSHVTTGDRLWSNMPWLRPIATVVDDSLDWYGRDADGGSVHDVIGTRCDPYTNHMLKGQDYHYCCHSNLTRALAGYLGKPAGEVEQYVHDVMNVFMCTGFTLDTRQYFMKASPVRPGDYIEFFAEIDLLGGLSACPGGNCGSSHSDDKTPCYPLLVQVYRPPEGKLASWQSPQPAGYSRSHGL